MAPDRDGREVEKRFVVSFPPKYRATLPLLAFDMETREIVLTIADGCGWDREGRRNLRVVGIKSDEKWACWSRNTVVLQDVLGRCRSTINFIQLLAGVRDSALACLHNLYHDG